MCREPQLPSTSVQPPETAVHPAPFTRQKLADHPYTLSVAFRHSGWHGPRQLVYDAYRRIGVNPAQQSDFALCGSHAYVLRSKTEADVYRVAGSTCRHRFCTPCAIERSRTIALNVSDYLDKAPCRFLTLTLQSSTESLAFLLAKLSKSFAKLRRWPEWQQCVSGGVAFLEIKWNEDTQRWHPHLHCLIQGNFLHQRRLSARWLQVTGSSKVVDIRMVKDHRTAVRYVVKYASKPLNASFLHIPERLDEAMLALKGKRLCLTFGDWQKLMLVTHPAEDAWENLGSLDALVHAAAAGDEAARLIVVAVARDDATALLAAAQAERPPPESPAPQWQQLTFWSAFRQSTIGDSSCRILTPQSPDRVTTSQSSPNVASAM